MLLRGLRRGQVDFRSHNLYLPLGASSPGRRRACVVFGGFFRGGCSPTGLPGDTAWLAFSPTGWGWLGVLSHSSGEREKTITSPRCTKHICNWTSARIISVVFRKVAVVLQNPKGRRTHCHAPERHVNAFRCISSSATGIFQWPASQSSVENTLASPRESMHSSILGLGYAYLTGAY